MDELDVLLSVIENPTRRRILEALVREPHYPLQLSRELGMSQQIIMKHLKVLEECRMVRSYPEESDQGGPMRKRYVPISGFSIIVDVGSGMFSVESMRREMDDEPEHHHEKTRGEQGNNELTERVMALRQELSILDGRMDELRKKREELIDQKQRLLDEAVHLVESATLDYGQRHVVFEYIQHPDIDPDQLADYLGLRNDVVREILGPYQRGDEQDG
ncbi:MAG TPA: ArsR family transcriptional regulator [Methanomassiliicoccales archaeon]|jgi:predicted transcriptional regulator